MIIVIVIVDDKLEGRPKPKGEYTMQRKVKTRPVALRAVNRTYDIMVSLFGNVWRMPKSVRDNYRGMMAVDDYRQSSYVPTNSEEWNEK